MKFGDANLQVDEKSSCTHPPSYTEEVDDDYRQVYAHTHLQRPVALYKVITSFHQWPIKQALHHTNI